jgi:hypothetical protein
MKPALRAQKSNGWTSADFFRNAAKASIWASSSATFSISA